MLLLRLLRDGARTRIVLGRRPDASAPVSGTGKREGGGSLGAGPGAAGPAPRECPTPIHQPGRLLMSVTPLSGSRLMISSLWPRRLQSRATVAGGFTVSPTLRAGTVFYTCRSYDQAPGIAFVLRRLEARTGGANPSDPRRSRETPDLVTGRSLQPCPLLIQSPDQPERFPLTSPGRSTLILTTLAIGACLSSS